ncbi:MAG: hypothetical protein LCH93_06830 [Proteobacteria bacterium]|nr:hypothetical protein [Pseudomonadota bacterium]
MVDIVTDGQIQGLRELPKKLVNPRARQKHTERFITHDFKVESLDGTQKFSIYKRQNLADSTDFSVGIRWEGRSAEITLARYNGSSHEHTNHIEGDKLSHVCHVHHATERYQMADRKPEGYATATSDYMSLDGAFRCLLADWNIQQPNAPEPSGQSGDCLFDDAPNDGT